jgi:hypothetical protein
MASLFHKKNGTEIVLCDNKQTADTILDMLKNNLNISQAYLQQLAADDKWYNSQYWTRDPWYIGSDGSIQWM